MTPKKFKSDLKKSFLAGVDGANANLFAIIYSNMVSRGLFDYENKGKVITMDSLREILDELCDKQDEAIDKYIGL